MPRAVDGQLQAAVDALQRRVDEDPEIQAILQREGEQLRRTHDRGGSARDYQQTIRDQITAIAKRKGYLPEGGQYFVNPNDGQLEPHGGWAGLSNKTRAAIIAAAATAGTFGLSAAGVFGSAAGTTGTAAGGTLPSFGPTAAMVKAGMTLPSVSMTTPAAASALSAAGRLATSRAPLDLITKGYNITPNIPGVTGGPGGPGGTPSWLKNVVDSVTGNDGNTGDNGKSFLDRVLDAIKKYGPTVAGVAIPTYAMWRGSRDKPPAEDQINQLLGIAQRRIEGAEPLYQALNTMAHSQLPDYTKQPRG